MDDFSFYKSVLRKWYDEVKNGENAMYLSMPAQARLRNLCVEICRKGNHQDLITFRNFLGFEFDESQPNKIRKETDKFRPIVRFMLNQSSLADMESVEMLAMLIGFEYRPFKVFLANKEKFGETPQDLVAPVGPPTKSITDTIVEEPPFPQTGFSKWKLAAIAGIVLIVGTLIITLPSLNDGDCMEWKGDHYERVECEAQAGVNSVKLFSDSQFPMRKIRVSAKTVFFRKEEPIVWYLKHDGQYDFFDRPGFHPVLEGKRLNPVSKYIAMEVVDGSIKSSR